METSIRDSLVLILGLFVVISLLCVGVSLTKNNGFVKNGVTGFAASSTTNAYTYIGSNGQIHVTQDPNNLPLDVRGNRVQPLRTFSLTNQNDVTALNLILQNGGSNIVKDSSLSNVAGFTAPTGNSPAQQQASYDIPITPIGTATSPTIQSSGSIIFQTYNVKDTVPDDATDLGLDDHGNKIYFVNNGDGTQEYVRADPSTKVISEVSPEAITPSATQVAQPSGNTGTIVPDIPITPIGTATVPSIQSSGQVVFQQYQQGDQLPQGSVNTGNGVYLVHNGDGSQEYVTLNTQTGRIGAIVDEPTRLAQINNAGIQNNPPTPLDNTQICQASR